MIQPASNSPELTELERLVLETAGAAAGDAARWRTQIEAATVARRTPSGVGFMTRLHIPAADRLAADGLSTISGEHPALPSGAEFVVQVAGGRINSIEAFCHEGMWPADESQFRLFCGP